MRNLDRSKLGDRNCDYSCEYCSYGYQYHRNNHQYLQRIKKVSIKKDRQYSAKAAVFLICSN